MTPFGKQFADYLRTVAPGSHFRLAPTPSGYLHTGNALNFLLNWTAARASGASLLLRIDDLDADRKRPEYVQDIFSSLEWLGINWDEGPRSVADFEQQWSQHLRLSTYETLLGRLRQTGLLFACRKSRSDLAPFEGFYPPEFRNQSLTLDDPDVAWRIKTPEGFPMPDFVVRRRDGLPAYQIASLADDLHFNTTHIIRGIDLEPSTLAQRFLAECLEEEPFMTIRFLHHPLLTDSAGSKLSKSAGAAALSALRQGGAVDVFGQVAAALGWPVAAVASDLLRVAESFVHK
jgi:glutamyl/glutaminyl-tRNA synthetase